MPGLDVIGQHCLYLGGNRVGLLDRRAARGGLTDLRRQAVPKPARPDVAHFLDGTDMPRSMPDFLDHA